MHTRVQKWGNSLGLRIPLYISKLLDLHPGNAIDVEVDSEGSIVIRKVKYDLTQMLEQISSQNSHSILLDDSQKGGEEW